MGGVKNNFNNFLTGKGNRAESNQNTPHLTQPAAQKLLALFLGTVLIISFLLVLIVINEPKTQNSQLVTYLPKEQTKFAKCKIQGELPDPSCTPGSIFRDTGEKQICVKGYSRTVRNVPTSLKNKVYAEYGISSHKSGEYEVDHFISLELGGSNDISNLWPEPALPKPGFHEKDILENYLHAQVCSGRLTLAQAQFDVSVNWPETFNKLDAKNPLDVIYKFFIKLIKK